MKTLWEYSLKTEALRILHCARQISVGFYRANNFYVLPYRETNNKYSDVVFPDLPYCNIPRFWKKVASVNTATLPIKANNGLIKQIEKLTKSSHFPKPKITNVKKVWEKAQKEIIKDIYQIMPDRRSAIKKIIIYPTLFGTSTSFSLLKSFPATFIIYLREDQDIYTITEALTTSLTRSSDCHKSNPKWLESEFLTDWLMTKSVIANVLNKYQPKTNWTPTIKQVGNKQNARPLKESEEFYKKLGVPMLNKPFSSNGKIPLLNGKPINNLTEREREMLVAMINKKGDTLTFDELGEILFINEKNFSLYAISKTIQRLRDKFEENGVSGSYIQTLRGKGYLLKN